MVHYYNKEKEKRHRNEFLNNLIFNRIQSLEHTIKTGKSFGMDLSRPYMALIVNINSVHKDSEPSNDSEMLDNIDRFINNATLLDKNKYICWNNSDEIIILCPVKAGCNNQVSSSLCIADKIKTSILNIMPDSLITMGIGRHYSDILSIRKSYQEAQKSTLIGGMVWGNDGIYHYDELGVYQLLSQFTNKEQSDDFINNTLGKLIEYDNKKNSQLLLTLEQLLTSENFKDIAEKLYIHPKTISFRKRRIEEILGLTLDDPEKRLSLSLAIKLYRLSNSIKNP